MIAFAIRLATPADAPATARFVDMAGDGLPLVMRDKGRPF